MVKAHERIKVYKDEKCLEITALFDTGAGGSYLNDQVADKLGYEKYSEPILISLAVKDKKAEVIGRLHCYIEIDRNRLPEEETIGVIRDLSQEAVIGLNLIEKYNIILEKDEIKFKEYPPRAFLF